MSKQVEFFYDYGSPAAYIAWARLPGICAEHGAELVRKPVLLGGIFKASGNQTPVNVKAKGEWMFVDLARHAAFFDVPFKKNPYFIINTLPLMRGAMWAREQGELEKYDQVMFEAIWAHEKDMNTPEVVAEVLTEGGFDASEVFDAVQQPQIKQQLIAATEEAVSHGLFGVPSMIVDGALHFGQDRLDWVERALAA
ncbi:MAG: 2-hydroxychromene-2-carboxylate isomerase [Pseudomonadota bacterium]